MKSKILLILCMVIFSSLALAKAKYVECSLSSSKVSVFANLPLSSAAGIGGGATSDKMRVNQDIYFFDMSLGKFASRHYVNVFVYKNNKLSAQISEEFKPTNFYPLGLNDIFSFPHQFEALAPGELRVACALR